jgi:hypothetical protein
MAVGSIKGLGWFLCGVIVAPTCYVATSQVAAERQHLRQVNAKIAQAKKDILGLQTEFTTRANLAQIEQWNGDVLAMSAPGEAQFKDDTQLASLDADDTATLVPATLLVVPKGTPKLSPEPAVEKGVTATAQNDAGKVSPMRTATRVAMVDTSRLLSASTMSDLEQGAASEKLHLR